MSCRRVTKNDVPCLFQMLKAMAEEEGVGERFVLTEEKVHQSLFKEKVAEGLVVDALQSIVGVCLFSGTHRNFDLFPSPGLYIHNLYVTPAYRRAGVAKEMVKTLKTIAKERQCSRIDWVVLKKNTEAVSFWRQFEDSQVVDYIDTMRFVI